MPFLIFIGQCVYFMLPAYVANTVPVILKRLRWFDFLAVSVDGGRKFRGNPILGSHKTIRGFLFGTIAAVLIALIQMLLFSIPVFEELSLIDYSKLNNVLLFGFLIGFGSLVGDSAGSFLKRRLKKDPGESWIPNDQISLAVGTLVFVLPIFVPSFLVVAGIIGVTLIWHIIFRIIISFFNVQK